MTKINVVASIEDYRVFDNSILVTIEITEREAAMLTTAIDLFDQFSVWNYPSPADADEIDALIQSIKAKLT